MKSFFVPIYLKLGKLSDEKLLVALIFVTPDKVLLKYSQKRIHLTSQVVNPEYANLAKEVLTQVEIKAIEVNKLLNKTGELQLTTAHAFNADYFEYLKKYSQNTLMFGALETINFQKSSMSFDSIYESLMNEKIELVKSVKHSFDLKIKSQLKASGIENKADIEYKISPKQVAGLYNDMIVSVISKNGSLFAAKAIDFNNGMQTLVNSLNAFDVLINSLNQFSKKNNLKSGTYNILNSKPEIGSEQEKLMNNIFKNKKDIYTLVPEDSIQEITSMIKAGPYQKFSTAFN
jgi:hypothetical protein